MFDFRLHLSNSCQHDCVRFALRPFLTTFEEQQKKSIFYHIINNMAQRYEYQDIDGHVILLFVHPAPFFVMSGDTPPHGRGSIAPFHFASAA